MKPIAVAALIASSAVAGGCGLPGGMLAGRATATVSRTYPLNPGGQIRIRNTNGRVDVQTVEGSTVAVDTERIARATTDTGARELLDRVRVTEEATPERVSLTTESMGMLIGASFEVRYHVRAPKGAAVDLQTTNGAVEVDGVTGDSELKTTNGAISGTAMSGRVTAHTTNGSVHMALVSLVGPVELGTTNGSVSLTLPPQAKADLSATTVNGRIDLSGVQLTSTGSESRRHVEGMLNGGGSPIRLTTTNGSIRVRTGS